MPRSEFRAAVAACLWLLASLFAAGAAQAAPRIGLVTMEPGEVFFERFGHNAIVVDDPARGEALSYNFGFFDLDEPGFHADFVRGRMQYRLQVLPLRHDLAYYAEVGRGVGVQWLDLEPARAAAVAAALAENARPENARYAYDYFTDNCSTRTRDVIDRALDGALRSQLSGRSQGNTYRGESVRLASPAPWMAVGFHVGLGGAADRPLSRWEEAFIPMRLRDALREVTLADGRPLVLAEEVLLPHRLPAPPADAPRLRGPALLAGLLLAAAALLAARRRPRRLAAVAGIFWLACGLGGLVMAFLWLGTAHRFAHANENLLLLNPLCLALLPGAWAMARGRAASARFRAGLWVVAGAAAVAGFMKFLPFLPQENVEWVLLLLPLHWALARGLDPEPR